MDEILIKDGDLIQQFIMVINGEFEVFYVDNTGFEFVIERISSGAILNYRTWFLEDETMRLNIRCSKRANILTLDFQELLKFAANNSELDKVIIYGKNRVIKRKVHHLLDLLQYSLEKERNINSMNRRILLKNTVLNILAKNRTE